MSGWFRRQLTREQCEIISDITSRGDRAEIIPTPDGLKIISVRRMEVKQSVETKRKRDKSATD